MSFVITGLSAAAFQHLFSLGDAELQAAGAVRRTAETKPGFPCRVSLEDADPGETVLLIHHESHSAPTPYRSAYAIYVRESAREPAIYRDTLPPVFANRPIALRLFSSEGMLLSADMGVNADVKVKIEAAFERPDVGYIHAHNAMHGCFVAEIRRAD